MKRVSRFIIATLSAAIILFSNADDVIANEKMVIAPAVCESLPDTIPCGKVLSDSIIADSLKNELGGVKCCDPDSDAVIWSLRTNVLYDAALVPNLGFDLYLSSGWSLSVFWYYSWWSKNARRRFWRTYGGDITARRWLGSASKQNYLTGHHLGGYIQASTFDFELGGKGYMGGKPGGSLWDKMNWSIGVEYGYSLPVSRHFNVDFTIAVGYTDCTYHVYRPEDQCYVRESTKHLRTVLPTKAEVSLVWIIGNDSRNRQKGGAL